MASAATVMPFGLLHMRLLQRWLHDRVPRWTWRHGTGFSHLVLPPHLQPVVGSCFLRRKEFPLAQVSRDVVPTYTSTTGWGAMCNGHAAARLWTGPQLQWNINCLQLLAVWLALRRFKTLLHKRHLLVRTNNTATIAYINHQGGLRSLSEGTLGTDALAHSWSWGLRKYEFPPVSLLAQTLCKVREDEEQVLLVAPYWPNRTWFPELMLLATAPPWKISLRSDSPFSERRHPLASTSRTCGISMCVP